MWRFVAAFMWRVPIAHGRKAFESARRQRGAVKTRVRPARGRIAQLFPVDEYGYIEAEDGHNVYFQKSSALNDVFDRLSLGSRVSFVEEHGEKGAQASTMRLLHSRRVHRIAERAASARVGVQSPPSLTRGTQQ